MQFEEYNAQKIEQKWSRIWQEQKRFKVDLKKAKKPFYNLMMFPYPSGEGLHVGHVYAFGGSDTFGRFKRLKGFDVFEPMGFDSFGIHSENFAIKKGIHPKELIEKTTAYFREKQLKRLGALFDWDHEVITSEPAYYKWTQWLFVELFKSGLAVRKKAPVDWCPSCKTVLADEQVLAGRCERCGSIVEQKELEQWFFKITNYAERLLNNLERIDWSETTKHMQRNWIGRSQGVEIKFPIKGSNQSILVFTTRPDTVFGATFLVLAPEHPLIEEIIKNSQDKQLIASIKNYVEKTKVKTEQERLELVKEKTGVFTGAYAVNPFTNKEIPVWIADFVLYSYGTGAIMAVPAHDQRDFEFATKFGLEIKQVIEGGDVSKSAYEGEGKLINSANFSGLSSKEAIDRISDYIESNKIGKRTVKYHLRDWLISRQRYWGPPIPMIFCETCKEGKISWFSSPEAKKRIKNKLLLEDLSTEMAGWYPVETEDLPVELPFIKDYQPKGTGVSPLATVDYFVKTKCPNGHPAKRETDVSDTFLDSSWYFLRYPTVTLPNQDKVAFDKKITEKWLPVDMYIGGNEHAVLHLLYTRFITMALKDMGHIKFEEPFKKFRAHGLIIKDGAKMSKSRGNVVNPNEFLDSYGSDTLRMYLLFIGPYELGGDFSVRAIAGVNKFLTRVWKVSLEISRNPAKVANKNVRREINLLIRKIEDMTENLKFNTSIASLMEFLNFISRNKKEVDIETLKKYLIVLSAYAPFIAEELWQRIIGNSSVHDQKWPKVDQRYLEGERIVIPIQLNGKLRDRIEIEASEKESKEKVLEKALSSKKIKDFLTGKKVKQVVYIPGKIINIVLQ